MSSAIDVTTVQPPKISHENPQLSSLAPVTVQRLSQFHNRHSRLSATGGLSWMIVVAVCLLLLAVVIDALIYHPSTRWWLAGSVFTFVALGLLWFCLRPLLLKPLWASIARRIESLEPKLKNQLLSAVELSGQPNQNDSIAFRHQVQRNAAARIGPIDVADLLPSKAILRPTAIALLTLAGFVGLFFVPNLHLGQRLSRILLPWANVGRISSVFIQIETPDVTQSALIFPRGEMTGVVARIEGPLPNQVLLHTRVPGEDSSGLPIVMSALDASKLTGSDSLATASNEVSRFETVLPMDRELMEFRVVARDAETPWYRVKTIPRPKIEQFEVLITPPSYSKLPNERFTSPTADVVAMQGSVVRLTLDTMPDSRELEGLLQWTDSLVADPARVQSSQTHESLRDPTLVRGANNNNLKTDSEGKLFAEFTADADREFKIDLKHQQSGIKNDYNPTYHLRVSSDLAPKLAWVEPTTTSMLASKQDLLGLKLIIGDELPVDVALGRYRVNSQEWARVDLKPEFPLESAQQPSLNHSSRNPQRELLNTDLQWLFDLSKVQLQTGDLVDIEVTAVDRKGQQGTSPILRLMISTQQSDINPSSQDQARQQIKQELAELARQAKPLAEAADELRKNRGGSPAEALKKLSELDQQLREKADSKLDELQKKIEELLRSPQDRTDQQELLSLGKLVEKWQNQTLPALQELSENSQDKLQSSEFKQADDKARNQLVHPLADKVRQAVNEIDQTANNFEMISDNDAARRIAARSMQLSDLTAQLKETIAKAKSPEEVIARKQQILAEQATELRAAMDQAQSTAGKHFANQLQNLRGQVENAESTLERSPAEYKQQAHNVPATLAQIRSQISSSMQQSANNSRRQLTHAAGTGSERIVDAIHQWDRSSTQAAAKTQEAAERLKDLRSLHTAGDIADRQFAADLGNAQRALQQSTQSSDDMQQQGKEVREIAKSLRTLEAAHALEQANNTLSQLISQEGQSQFRTEMTIEHPRLWDTYAEQLERAVKVMREAQVPNAVVEKTQQLQWSQAAGQAGEKIGERIWSNEPMTTAKPELLQLNNALQEMRGELKTIADQARLALQQQAPSLSELAQQAANSAEQLVDQTQQLAENVQKNQVPDPSARLDVLKQQVEPASENLETLRDALADLAGAQNFLDAKQIEQAKKADAAMGVVAKAEEQLDRSLDKVQPADSSDTKASSEMTKELSRAANKQSDVAGAMRNLAKFLASSMEPNGSPTESNAQTAKNDLQDLETLANSLGQDSQQDNADSSATSETDYEKAQRLAQIAGLSPEEMLKSLEKQLQNNQAMQQEMSEIAADAANQALRQLDRSQKIQDTITPSLEQSDPKIKAQKELMAHDLNTVKNEASRMLNRLLQEANNAAQSGTASQPAEKLRGQAEQLQKALSSVPNITSSSSTEELQKLAQQIGRTLDQVHDEAAKVAEDLEKAAGTAIENQNDKQKEQQQRDAVARRDRSKNQSNQEAEHLRHVQQRAADQSKAQVQQAAREHKQAENQLNKSEQDLQKQPDQQWIKDTVQRQRREWALHDAKLQSAKQFEEAMQQRYKSADENAKQVKQAPVAELNQPNAYAQLAQSLSQQAAEQAGQLANQIDQWEKDSNLAPEASGQEVASQAVREATVQNQVQSAAQDLARASRHESRLNHESTSQQLAQLSNSTEQVASQPLQQSRDQLAQAQESSQGHDRATGQASSATTAASIAAAQEANKAIKNAAQSLRAALDGVGSQTQPGENQADSNNANSNSQASAQSTSPSTLSPEQMAHLLDELDRQLSSDDSQSSSQQSDSASQSSSASQSKQAGNGAKTPATLAQAAQQLAEQMSRQRQSASQSDQNSNQPANQPSSQLGQSQQSKSSRSSKSGQSSMSRASAQLQPADAFQVVDVARINDQWGELRQQEATETVETQRDKSASRYRRAIDAYFKALAESASNGKAQNGTK
jgi:hypothetical protein